MYLFKVTKHQPTTKTIPYFSFKQMPEPEVVSSLEKQEYASIVLWFIACIWLLFDEASVNPSEGKAASWEWGRIRGEGF